MVVAAAAKDAEEVKMAAAMGLEATDPAKWEDRTAREKTEGVCRAAATVALARAKAARTAVLVAVLKAKVAMRVDE